MGLLMQTTNKNYKLSSNNCSYFITFTNWMVGDLLRTCFPQEALKRLSQLSNFYPLLSFFVLYILPITKQSVHQLGKLSLMKSDKDILAV